VLTRRPACPRAQFPTPQVALARLAGRQITATFHSAMAAATGKTVKVPNRPAPVAVRRLTGAQLWDLLTGQNRDIVASEAVNALGFSDHELAIVAGAAVEVRARALSQCGRVALATLQMHKYRGDAASRHQQWRRPPGAPALERVYVLRSTVLLGVTQNGQLRVRVGGRAVWRARPADERRRWGGRCCVTVASRQPCRRRARTRPG
jgi:hypothetical protein